MADAGRDCRNLWYAKLRPGGGLPVTDPVPLPCPAVGQLVVLRSGGPVMTVHDADGCGVVCQWMDDHGTLHQDTFPAVALYGCEPL